MLHKINFLPSDVKWTKYSNLRTSHRISIQTSKLLVHPVLSLECTIHFWFPFPCQTHKQICNVKGSQCFPKHFDAVYKWQDFICLNWSIKCFSLCMLCVQVGINPSSTEKWCATSNISNTLYFTWNFRENCNFFLMNSQEKNWEKEIYLVIAFIIWVNEYFEAFISQVVCVVCTNMNLCFGNVTDFFLFLHHKAIHSYKKN